MPALLHRAAQHRLRLSRTRARRSPRSTCRGWASPRCARACRPALREAPRRSAVRIRTRLRPVHGASHVDIDACGHGACRVSRRGCVAVPKPLSRLEYSAKEEMMHY